MVFIPFVPRTCPASFWSSFLHHMVPGPDLAMICCEQIKSLARAQRCEPTLHVTTQILRKSFKFRHRNENK